MENEALNDSLLGGIRVLDLADEKACFCSKLLADLGACVVKVEKPGGDPSRNIGPFFGNSTGQKNSLFFHYNNTNKLGITLNLQHSAGREIFFKLIKKTDVFVETFPPGHLKKLGLDFDVLTEMNSRIIMVSITGFGQNGPRRDYKSCDLVASAYGGQMYVSGSPSDPPLKPFGGQSYYTASLFGAIGILLAIRRRNQTGKGEQIDISLQEAVTSTLDHVMVQYFYEQAIAKRRGSLHWNNAFCILPCKDGHILLTLFHQWETLVEWMEGDGMAGDLTEKEWHDEEYRLKHLDHVIEVLEKWTRTHSVKDLFKLGQLMRFPWAPVYSPKEVLDSPQLKARGFFAEIDHPEVSASLKYPGIPYKFDSSVLNQRRRAPFIGEHNARIYGAELGFTEKELKRLFSIRAI